MKSKEKIAYLKLAKIAALKAGEFLLKEGKKYIKVVKDEGRDIKLEADTEAERVILKELESRSCFSILSEEAGEIGSFGKTPLWIVDPLDGTFNYARGISIGCVSIALWEHDKPILGVIYDFNRNELFEGMIGCDARLNGKRIRVSSVNKKSKAVMYTGFPSRASFDKKNLTRYVKNFKAYKKVRMIGSAAISLAYVACGRADSYEERNIMLWDAAGGAAMVLAAGGSVRIRKTNKKHSYNIFASNGSIKE